MGDKSMSTKEQHIEKELEKKSQTEKYLLNFPPEEKYLGFENDSNICYANSAMQVLYHCKAFREQVVNWKPCNTQKYYLINELADLFKAIKSANFTGARALDMLTISKEGRSDEQMLGTDIF